MRISELEKVLTGTGLNGLVEEDPADATAGKTHSGGKGSTPTTRRTRSGSMIIVTRRSPGINHS
jgi:hypothetical protein